MTTKELSSSARSLMSLPVFLVLAGFTLFVVFSFWDLHLNPFSPKVQLKFFGIDQSRNSKVFALNINETTELLLRPNSSEDVRHQEVQDLRGKIISSDAIREVEPSNHTVYANASKPMEDKLKQPFQGFSNDSRNVHSIANDVKCDLYQGKWFYDPSGPLYTNNKCPILTKTQNCQGNGRPDKEYENWRWKPAQCDLPRFNVTEFFELMRGKTLAFIGDSIARNQMESLVCILWQVEEPKNHGRKGFHRWYFSSTSTTIIRIWSSWLVNNTLEPFQYAPKGITKLYLDIPDDEFMKYLPKFDVVVISGGHWFNKKSVYILNNEIVGGQLWSPNKTFKIEVDKVQAFTIGTETALSAIASHPKFKGLVIVRSFAPNHYVGGAWNTGGTCTGKQRPASENELVKHEFTDTMQQKQVKAFNNAIKKATNKSKMRYMNITKVFEYRHDGHPGPYGSDQNPKNVTIQGQQKKLPPAQDCLHWCMPGAVDTWNEIVLAIIRREFKGAP